MELKLDKRFRKRAKGMFNKYAFEVGVLNDGPHKRAKDKSKGLKSFANGPARKTSSRESGQSIAQVSEHIRKRTDYLRRPFDEKNSATIKFLNQFMKFAFKKTNQKRVENLLQSVVRNPILKGKYGRNTAKTAKYKGFNRFMIDTGQLFKAIKAKVVRV